MEFVKRFLWASVHAYQLRRISEGRGTVLGPTSQGTFCLGGNTERSVGKVRAGRKEPERALFQTDGLLRWAGLRKPAQGEHHSRLDKLGEREERFQEKYRKPPGDPWGRRKINVAGKGGEFFFRTLLGRKDGGVEENYFPINYLLLEKGMEQERRGAWKISNPDSDWLGKSVDQSIPFEGGSEENGEDRIKLRILRRPKNCEMF